MKSELDWQIYLLQRRYLDYQVNVGNKMIDLLGGDEEQRGLAPALSIPKRKFQDMMDDLFSYTRLTARAMTSSFIKTVNAFLLINFHPVRSRCL